MSRVINSSFCGINIWCRCADFRNRNWLILWDSPHNCFFVCGDSIGFQLYLTGPCVFVVECKSSGSLTFKRTSSYLSWLNLDSLFPGNALLRRLVRIGVLDESRMKLDYVLGLKIEDFLERRLQTQVTDESKCSLWDTRGRKTNTKKVTSPKGHFSP